MKHFTGFDQQYWFKKKRKKEHSLILIFKLHQNNVDANVSSNNYNTMKLRLQEKALYYINVYMNQKLL
jgi:hypothetical protein